VVLVITVDKILHDGSAFKESNGLPVREGVCEGRNSSIGVDLEKPGFLPMNTYQYLLLTKFHLSYRRRKALPTF
jgi:hypothetical protein